MHSVEKNQNNAVTLLKQLISIKSFSFQEDETADTIQEWLKKNNIKTERQVNNVIACNKFFDPKKPSIAFKCFSPMPIPITAATIFIVLTNNF